MTLIERLEQATADQQRELLVSAYEAIHGERPCLAGRKLGRWLSNFQPFSKMLDAQAYESAAMTLVPEGWVLAALSQVDDSRPVRQWFVELRRGFKTSYDKAIPVWAPTPAIALCIAALRAKDVE